MANARSANNQYVDATGVLTTTGTRVSAIVVTATSASAICELSDNQTVAVKVANLRVATAGDSKLFDFSQNPMFFPNGVKVTTLTNAIVTLIYT